MTEALTDGRTDGHRPRLCTTFRGKTRVVAVHSENPARLTEVVVVVVVVEMNIIKVALSHFCCKTTVQSDSVSVARQVTVRRW